MWSVQVRVSFILNLNLINLISFSLMILLGQMGVGLQGQVFVGQSNKTLYNHVAHVSS